MELTIELHARAEEVADLLAPADESYATENRPTGRPKEHDYLFARQEPLTQDQARSPCGNIDKRCSEISAGAAWAATADDLRAGPGREARWSRPWGLRRLGGETTFEHSAMELSEGR